MIGKKKRITPKQMINAAKKNGYKLSRSAWFRGKGGFIQVDLNEKKHPIYEACFMGQISINLGVKHTDLMIALNEHYGELEQDILRWNDEENISYEEMLKRFTAVVTEYEGRAPKSMTMQVEEYNAVRKV